MLFKVTMDVTDTIKDRKLKVYTLIFLNLYIINIYYNLKYIGINI